MSTALTFDRAAPHAGTAETITELTTSALVRQIAAAAERKAEQEAERKARHKAAGHEERPLANTYRRAAKGRPFTAREMALGAVLAAAFAWAVWLQARPVPMDADVAHYHSLAMTAGEGSLPAQAFVESSLLAIGREWSSATLFARVHPRFWGDPKVVEPNLLARRVGEGLAQLSGQGKVVKVTVLEVPALVTEALRTGGTVLVGEVRGQVEFDNGTALPFTAGLIRDEAAGQWGLTSLAIAPALP